MKRTPRGGKKVNYTLYLSQEERDKIKDRAKELDMSDAYYLLQLVHEDILMRLTEHLEAGGAIAPVTISESTVAPDLSFPVEEVKNQVNAQQEANPDNVAFKPGEVPSEEVIAKAQEAMQENLLKAPRQENIELPPEEQVVVSPGPTIQRPAMRSIQDVINEQTGIPNVARQTNVRDPGATDGEIRAATTGGGQWADRMHREIQSDERGETEMRRQILESLPPVEKEEG